MENAPLLPLPQRAPIAATGDGDAARIAASGAFGLPELSAEGQADVAKLLERQKVTFTAASGALAGGVSKASLAKVWAGMRLGHRFSRRKDSIRALVLQADLFAPNVAKHGAVPRLDNDVAVDKEAMKCAFGSSSQAHQGLRRAVVRRG